MKCTRCAVTIHGGIVTQTETDELLCKSCWEKAQLEPLEPLMAGEYHTSYLLLKVPMYHRGEVSSDVLQSVRAIFDSYDEGRYDLPVELFIDSLSQIFKSALTHCLSKMARRRYGHGVDARHILLPIIDACPSFSSDEITVSLESELSSSQLDKVYGALPEDTRGKLRELMEEMKQKLPELNELLKD